MDIKLSSPDNIKIKHNQSTPRQGMRQNTHKTLIVWKATSARANRNPETWKADCANIMHRWGPTHWRIGRHNLALWRIEWHQHSVPPSLSFLPLDPEFLLYLLLLLFCLLSGFWHPQGAVFIAIPYLFWPNLDLGSSSLTTRLKSHALLWISEHSQSSQLLDFCSFSWCDLVGSSLSWHHCFQSHRFLLQVE